MRTTSAVDVVRRAFDSFNEEGIEAVIDLFAPDFEVTVPPTLSAEPDTYRGRDGIRRWFAGFEGFMEDVRLEAEEFIDAGPDTAIGVMHLRARGTWSGIDTDQLVFQVFRLRDGKVRVIEPFRTREEALAAAGLDR